MTCGYTWVKRATRTDKMRMRDIVDSHNELAHENADIHGYMPEYRLERTGDCWGIVEFVRMPVVERWATGAWSKCPVAASVAALLYDAAAAGQSASCLMGRLNSASNVGQIGTKGTNVLLPTRHMQDVPGEELVDQAWACPACGERRVDSLAWIDDETVVCEMCDTRYSPNEEA